MLKGKQSRGPSCGADRLGTRGVGREASPAGGREGSFPAMGPSETPPLEGLCRGTGSRKARHAVGSRRPRSRPTRQEGQMPAPSVRGLGGWSSQGASMRRRVRAVAGPGGLGGPVYGSSCRGAVRARLPPTLPDLCAARGRSPPHGQHPSHVSRRTRFCT